MNRSILIIGAGEMGSALGHVLSLDKENFVEFWDKNPLQYAQKKDVRTLIANAGLIFICVPGAGVAEVVKMIKQYVGSETFIIALTKAIEPETKRFMAEVLNEEFGDHRSGLLAGPTLAGELVRDLPSTAVLAGSGYMFENVSKVFENTLLRVDYSEDIIGVSVLSVLKNIYSILLGAADALDMGKNTVGDLVTLMLHEMMEIADGFGGEHDSAFTHAGLGDLVATGTSKDSTNHKLGAAFAKGEEPQKYSEGYTSLPLLLERMGEVELPPLLMAARKFMIDKEPFSEALSEVL